MDASLRASEPAAESLREIVERFVARVEAGDNLGAMDDFYAPEASMQENERPPRRGREALIAHEQRMLAGVRWQRARCVRPVLVADDRAVVRWVFEYETLAGRQVRFEELAWQVWRDGRIVEEKFFYDPAQFAP